MQTKKSGVCILCPQQVFPIFSRYMEEICQDTVAAGNVQFLKNWNKIGKRWVQNTFKNMVNILQVAACRILVKSNKGYSSHCWRRSAPTNLTDAGVSFINLKRHEQWASNRVVEGFIANSLSLRLERHNCLLPAEESEQVRLVNSK